MSFTDKAALTESLRGIDALVLTVGNAMHHLQPLFIEAAIAAGVKRIIPSEFGSDRDNERVAALAVYKHKNETMKALNKAANEGKVTWTAVLNGPFLDWGEFDI